MRNLALFYIYIPRASEVLGIYTKLYPSGCALAYIFDIRLLASSVYLEECNRYLACILIYYTKTIRYHLAFLETMKFKQTAVRKTRIAAAVLVLAAAIFPVSKLTTQIIINNTVKPQFTPSQFTATSTLPKFSEKKSIWAQ